MKDHEKPGFDFTKGMTPSKMLARLKEFAIYGLDECLEIEQLMEKLTPIVAEADPVIAYFDMTDSQCEKCNKGCYVETSIHDDWDGVLHCDKCGYPVARRRETII